MFNVEEELRKLIADSVHRADRELEDAIINYFGSPEETIKRLPFYILEEVHGGVKNDSDGYKLDIHRRLRLKTPEELLKDLQTESERVGVTEQRKDDPDENASFPYGTPVGYVLVPTNFRINHIGSVHGIYPSKQKAAQARDELQFPNPREVYIRAIYRRE